MENDETKKDLGMSPPPMLLVSKSNKDHFEYIPQIHADEQGQLNVNLNKLKEPETKEESKVEILNDSYNKNEDFRLGNSSIMENHPLTKTEKKAIKLMTVPDEKENFQNPNPQEMESPSLDLKNQSNDMNLNESKFDSPGLSPNSVTFSSIPRDSKIYKEAPDFKEKVYTKRFPKLKS